MLESLIGHGIFCQGKVYEIVGVTGGDAYHMGGPDVFDVFDLSSYTFLEIENNTITGDRILNEYEADGVFKLLTGLVRNANAENVEQGATLHIRPTEAFVKPQGTNREHLTLTLVPSNFEYESSS